MTEARVKKVKPDIRAITRLVPPSGNLVQGQSELPIDPRLAAEAAAIIAASQNHYGGSEGDANLRKAVAEKIAKYNNIEVDVDARPFEVMITNGGGLTSVLAKRKTSSPSTTGICRSHKTMSKVCSLRIWMPLSPLPAETASYPALVSPRATNFLRCSSSSNWKVALV